VGTTRPAMRPRKPGREALYDGPEYRDLLERIAANVRRLREAQGLSQEECAYRCGDLSVPLLRRVEGAATNVTAVTLARLGAGLGVDVAELVKAGTPFAKRGPGRPAKAAPEGAGDDGGA
jgi:transcriptional regulator with XRE-family HTH domain